MILHLKKVFFEVQYMTSTANDVRANKIRELKADEKISRRGGMADALGSGPSSFTGVRVQLPPSAPIFDSAKHESIPEGRWLNRPYCGYGITAVHQPSKLVIRVRPPLPAPTWWDSRVAKGGRL